jgi:hypothetical protein
MGPAQPTPNTDGNANYRPILSSVRVHHFSIKKYPDQKKKRKNLVMGFTGRPSTKRD